MKNTEAQICTLKRSNYGRSFCEGKSSLCQTAPLPMTQLRLIPIPPLRDRLQRKSPPVPSAIRAKNL
jgi:hypothetical protein